MKIYKHDDFEHHETMLESAESAWHKASWSGDSRIVPELVLELTRNVKRIEEGQPAGHMLVEWEYWLERKYTVVGDTAQDILDFLAQYHREGYALVNYDNELWLVEPGD
jgi:hypothetical protein